MPLTFAHPAVVLPFSRNSPYIHFSAMVLGSMAPDFEYFLRGKPYGEVGHTFVGFITFNLPLVVIIYFIYRFYIHRTLFAHLPSFLQDPGSEKPQSTKVLNVIVFVYSALFGMLTHVVWDSFTHLEGLMVLNFPILTHPFHLYGFTIPVFKFLQHGSTLVGILAIIGYMFYRTTKNKQNNRPNPSPKQKRMYWGQIVLFTVVLFGLWSLIDQVSIESYGILVVRIIDSALLSLLFVSLCFKYLYKGVIIK